MFNKKFWRYILLLVAVIAIALPIRNWCNKQQRMARVPDAVMIEIQKFAAHAEAEVEDVCRVLTTDQKTGEIVGKTDRSVSGNAVYKYWDATFTAVINGETHTVTHRFSMCLLKGKLDSVRMIS